jgi:hypothetical protein
VKESSKKIMERTAEVLPPFNGRLAGFAYLLYLLTTLLTEYFMEQQALEFASYLATRRLQ